MTFSKQYRNYEDWLSSFKGSESYRNRIERLHSKYPNASLSQLRGHAPKGKILNKFAQKTFKFL